MKQLFVDDRFIESRDGLTRRFCTPEKYPGPVIRADRPWERDAAFIDTGLVIYDQHEDVFKAWYQGGGCYGPDDKSNMCYAISRDGVNWEKPSLGIVDFEGSKNNNLLLIAKCMMHDPAQIIDHADPDPARRYKAVWWGGRRDPSRKEGWLLGHCVGFSPDGIHWTEHPSNPVWPADGEVAIPSGIQRNRGDGKHVMYCSADGQGMRVVARTQSDDFVHWELPPKVVIRSDDLDSPGTEMAGLCAVNYEGTQLGLLYTIHNQGGISAPEWKQIVDRNIRQGFFGPPITMNDTRCRTMYTELVSSEDGGMSWKRLNRHPYIPLGEEGDWDETVSLAGRPIVARDRIWIFYAGMGRVKATPGKATPETIRQWNVETGLATLRLDGFVSLDAGSGGGTMVSRPFQASGGPLELNVHAPAGMAIVEILDAASGNAIDCYGAAAAQPIVGDHLRAPVSWRGSATGMAPLAGRNVKLRVSLKNARLFSVTIQ